MNVNSRYFTEILKYGNLSEAAKQLGISQPALSGYLKKLETECGASLLDRSQTPVVLTEAGKLYVEYVKNLLAVVDNAQLDEFLKSLCESF